MPYIVMEKGTTEDEMVEWHHQLNGHEFEQTPGESEGQGSLVCSRLEKIMYAAGFSWMFNKCQFRAS